MLQLFGKGIRWLISIFNIIRRNKLLTIIAYFIIIIIQTIIVDFNHPSMTFSNMTHRNPNKKPTEYAVFDSHLNKRDISSSLHTNMFKLHLQRQHNKNPNTVSSPPPQILTPWVFAQTPIPLFLQVAKTIHVSTIPGIFHPHPPRSDGSGGGAGDHPPPIPINGSIREKMGSRGGSGGRDGKTKPFHAVSVKGKVRRWLWGIFRLLDEIRDK